MNASIFVLSLATLAAAPQDALYDFSAPWCGPCQTMVPVVDKLQRLGLPIVKVNIDERPDLAQQFGIERIPAFVLVVHGTVQRKLIGCQDEGTLRSLCAQISTPGPDPSNAASPSRRSRALPVRLAGDETKSNWDLGFHLPLPAFPGSRKGVSVDTVASTFGSRKSPAIVTTDHEISTAAPEREPSQDRVLEDENSAPPSSMQGASVRIRVTDPTGVYFGSGVAIDCRPLPQRPDGARRYKVVVLTCGHILRDANKKDCQIEVDAFLGKKSRTYPGRILKMDLDADVGLMTLVSNATIAVCPLARPEEMVRRGDSVVSIGCSGGELPSTEHLQVTMLNRYLGPDTIECTGVPVKGRSGGGLFTTDGRIVGVCTNADLRERRGVYAGLKPILALLHTAGLDELGPQSKEPASVVADSTPPGRERDASGKSLEVAAEGTESSSDASSASSATDRPHTERRTQERTAPLALSRMSPESARTAPEATLPKMADEAEVVCIIRPLHNPRAASRVVIINKASSKFLSYLTGETKEPVQAIAAVQPEGKDAADSSVASTQGKESDSLPQTTAAWKPSTRDGLRETGAWHAVAARR